ncbi:MAG: tRNA pseudouridine(55) synthase TruB [Nitrospiraceae bacterium]
MTRPGLTIGSGMEAGGTRVPVAASGATGHGEAPTPQVLRDGILTVNKAAGWTSHDVVAKLRTLLRGPRIGHAGTLDPAATGVLPVLVGRATRIAEYLLDWDKEYLAVLRLGETTDTQDATGKVLARCVAVDLEPEAIRSVIAGFQGRLRQVPPMYSAVKVGGEPLYKAARAGRHIEREPRDITIHRIEVLAISGRDVTLSIVCSKGTYIRTLCADIGEALGVGGHLLALERRRVGPLTLDRALSIEEVHARLSEGRLAEDLMSLDEALQALPVLVVDEATSIRVLHGVPVPSEAVHWSAVPEKGSLRVGQPVRLKDPGGRLLALGEVPEGHLGTEAPGSGAPRAVPILKVLADVPGRK